MSRLEFQDTGPSPSGKTKTWEVIGNNYVLGWVRWYGQWRKYVFHAGAGSLYDAGCLNEISAFLIQETNAHKQQ
jgi:hypothetical protein